ncbi:hypothetical protein BB561_002773 [Smittium simulii]|uniref:protein-tyrosine-phosphatase n=1 Tax=Smittium simulii TaxID=133385 RepID=A0A2T9YP69_9FUNG|nr:hypothetical protein BB561_002773 [Smittium simulii]
MDSISSHQSFSNPRKQIGKNATPLANSFSLVEMNAHLRFLIMDCPTDSTISLYLKEFARLNVTDVVRVCEPTYKAERLEANGVSVHNFPFKDGEVPPNSVITSWLQIINKREAEAAKQIQVQPVPTTIAVHCVAGLGRAPVLVAIALTEQGQDPVAVIDHIRRKRRGAFNNKQISFLVNYKRTSTSRSRLSLLKNNSSPIGNLKNSSESGTPASSSASKDTNYKSFFKKVFGGHN